jgi:hypothetical protein
MAFILPTFNLTVNIWRRTNPVGNPPDVVVLGNLTHGKRVSQINYILGNPVIACFEMYLLLPKLTDIRGQFNGTFTGDVVECPGGTLRYYDAVFVDDVAKGFPNEHRLAVITQHHGSGLVPNWPLPIP